MLTTLSFVYSFDLDLFRTRHFFHTALIFGKAVRGADVSFGASLLRRTNASSGALGVHFTNTVEITPCSHAMVCRKKRQELNEIVIDSRSSLFICCSSVKSTQVIPIPSFFLPFLFCTLFSFLFFTFPFCSLLFPSFSFPSPPSSSLPFLYFSSPVLVSSLPSPPLPLLSYFLSFSSLPFLSSPPSLPSFLSSFLPFFSSFPFPLASPPSLTFLFLSISTSVTLM